MNVKKFKAKMIEADIDKEQLAELSGMHVSTLYRKLKNPDKITIAEAKAFKRVLKINDADACEIFLL